MINPDLWSAIEQYVKACGGNPAPKTAKKAKAITAIYEAQKNGKHEAFEMGIEAVYRAAWASPSYQEFIEDIAYRIQNPYAPIASGEMNDEDR